MQKNKRDSHFDRLFSHPPGKECPANASLLFLELLNTAHDGILAFDEISNLIYINQSAQQTLCIKADEVLGKPAVSFIDDDTLLSSITHSSLDAMQSFIWRKHSLIVTVSRLNEENSQKGCLLLLKETGSIKNSEDIDRTKEEFASLLESSYDGIILADRESILQVNASFGRITGVAPGQLIGKKFNELNSEKHVCLAAVQEVIRLTVYHKKTLTLQRRLTSGNEIFVTGNPLFDRHGQVIRVLLNVRDVTDLKSLEDQIKNVTNIYKETKAMSDVNPHFFQGIVAESPSMRRLIELVLRVSRVDSTVILVGESGVGKDVLARLLYRLSDRCQERFISVNCGAIPDNLLESEFFGYMKGAFTGASIQGKAGLFEQADGGILFLDEVGELPLHLQVKLLKAIQDRCCRRLGDTKNISFDVRIIAATNRDLHQMVADGLFRADLFYRLYVVPINIPALKDRREDILPLSLMFLMQNNQKYKVNCTFGHELMSILETYEWPGNVRELQNVVERMVVTADADVLMPRHLPRSVQNKDDIGLPYSNLPDTMNLKIAREALESRLIERAIAKTGNTRSTGKLLGIDHSTVIRKAQRYGIDIRAVVSRARQKAGDIPSR